MRLGSVPIDKINEHTVRLSQEFLGLVELEDTQEEALHGIPVTVVLLYHQSNVEGRGGKGG